MKYYIGYKEYQLLVEVDSETGIPTGSVKPNISSDPDYIPPILSPETCPPYTLFWRGVESSKVCVKDTVEGVEVNTGYSTYEILEEIKEIQYPVVIQTPTGNTKPNTPEEEDYIPPVINNGLCPLPERGWMGDENDTVECIVDEFSGQNTGYLKYDWRVEYVEVSGVRTLTGNKEENLDNGPNYVPPVYNTTACPIIRLTAWRGKEDSAYCEQIVSVPTDLTFSWDSRVYDFIVHVYESNNGVKGAQVAYLRKIQHISPTIFSHVLPLPDNSNYFIEMTATRVSSGQVLRPIRVEIPELSYSKSGAGYVASNVEAGGQSLTINMITY